MTDRRHEIEQAERIRRLQERRATSSSGVNTARRTATSAATGARRTASSTRTPAAVPVRTSSARRRHPAASTRILLAGLSVASFFGIAGSVALAGQSATSTAQPAAVTSTATGGTLAATSTATGIVTKPVGTSTQSAATSGTSTRVVHTTTRAS
jgi:hypothetical protein